MTIKNKQIQNEKELLNSNLTANPGNPSNPANEEQKKQDSSSVEGFIDGAADTLSYAGQYALDSLGTAGSCIADGAGSLASGAGDLASGAAEVAVEVVCSVFNGL